MISLAELQRRIEQGDVSSEAAIAQCCEAIDAQDETIGAFVCRAESPGAASAGPLRGIAVDAAYVASVITQTPGRVLAVGHSYGGAIITNAVPQTDNVAGLVYVAAFAPDRLAMT